MSRSIEFLEEIMKKRAVRGGREDDLGGDQKVVREDAREVAPKAVREVVRAAKEDRIGGIGEKDSSQPLEYTSMLTHLNQEQKDAVYDESRVCLVNANVGSGKTTVLIAKVLFLHYEKGIAYSDMAVLTFTNKAADEIKERLKAIEPDLKNEDLQYFGTFHSVALHLLRTRLPLELTGYQKGFLVIEPEEELDLALKVIRDHKLTIKYKNRLMKRLESEKINRYQDDLETLRELLDQEKLTENKMTFADLLQTAVMLMKREPVSYRNIVIDEVQDCDDTQLELIDVMLGKEAALFAVGDPNQVIYSWRGSHGNVFRRLKEKYHATERSLTYNYRSSGRILQAAKRFLQYESTLDGTREQGDRIVIRKQYDSFQEADYLADQIQQLHQKGIAYREIAVFYRLQNQSAIFEKVFDRCGIPFEVSVKKTIRDIPVLDWFMKVLRYAMNSKDALSLELLLDHKAYGYRKSDQKHRADYQEKLLQFQCRYASNGMTIPQIPDIYAYFDLEERLHPTSAGYEEDQAHVVELLSIMHAYIQEKHMPYLEGVADFVNSSALYGVNILQQDIHTEEDSVKLMTLHASKGLEFDHVYITGVNYGLIPLRAKTFEDEDEERRVFFVGLTRAKNHLELSYYTNPDLPRTMPGPSHFIKRFPDDLVERNDQDKADQVSAQDLQGLKKMILAEKKMKEIVDTSAKSKSEVGPQLERQLEPDVEPQLETEIEPNAASESKQTAHRVQHSKYGIGTIIKEDDMMVTAVFQGYGEKEFMKDFSELIYLDEG